MTTSSTATRTMMDRAMHGALAGLAGGVVFGLLMVMMGMLPMIAMLVGSTSPVVGALVHLVISTGLGVMFAVVVPAMGVAPTLAAGGIYGMVWWVLGPLLIMPARLGGPLFSIDATALASLMGHVIFGLVAAAVLLVLRRRARA